MRRDEGENAGDRQEATSSCFNIWLCKSTSSWNCDSSRAAYLWLHAIQEVGNCLWEGAGVFWVIYHAQNPCKALLHDRRTTFHFLYQPGNERLTRTVRCEKKRFTKKRKEKNHLNTSAEGSVRSLILRIASAAASWTKVLLCFRPTSRIFLHNLTEEPSPNSISVTVTESAINWHDAATTRSLRVVVRLISGMWLKCLKICYIILRLANYKYNKLNKYKSQRTLRRRPSRIAGSFSDSR